MNQNQPLRSDPQDHLSVIHRNTGSIFMEPVDFSDSVIQADLQFNISGWNLTAEKVFGLQLKKGRNLFEAGWTGISSYQVQEIKLALKENKKWSGEFEFSQGLDERRYFFSMINYIVNEDSQPIAFVMVNRDITDIKNKERKLEEAEKEYTTLVNTLFDGVMMIKADGKISAANRRAAEILGFSEEELVGKIVACPSWKAIRQDGTIFPLTEFPAVVSLQTGFPQRNVVMGIERADGSRIWVLVNSQALFQPGAKYPYAAVASFSDITEKVKWEEALRKSNERFYYAGKVTSDAIWDIDLETNEIYRSEAFNSFSGYKIDQIEPNLDWWINKVHPDDQERVRKKISESISKGIARWEDEYRFLCADGNYKYLLDSGIILYKNQKPARIIGAIQDLTERRQLEERLLTEEIQKQKQVNQATIAAQEQERNSISCELHDNVNQILMSAKLFMNTAQKNPGQCNDLLEKAIEYQMMALEEIRKISKSLNSSLIKTVGLRESIIDIVNNMKLLQQLDVTYHFNQGLEEKLSNEQKIMIYRIIQEQTNNIIKYASARTVQILINESKGELRMIVSDDGKGFDPNQRPKGIGFTNIFNRADAYNGKVNIISSPGNGCILELQFPL